MRTTITIDDELLAEAKQLAARTHRTVSSVLEDALREQLARREEAATERWVMPSFDGGGLLVDILDKEALADALGDNDRLP
ncbi:CopG family ribbon-helix-helix protein [Knoellia koreensis]|uniref:Ribbon-helix-helix protein, CopG family n=1 Tax=Knoellia koreensis TaxID=2730921 RepID=A0A849HCV2_9MICO|nr:type II toxin-antitoxin system VapB family antitoxin [Knoellia sp. DB2414S]NNM47576.1 ribbon-helix-helix protein, CopG family [Knoellia sp. DB2414S]